MPLKKGEKIDDFKILKYLDSGKAGDVYLVKPIKKINTYKEQKLAIKVYKSWVLERRNEVERIRREAKIGQKIRSPNLVRIYDVKINTDVPNGTYLVMEYIDGDTLKKWVSEHYPIDIKKFIDLAMQICEGVKTLHENGIIHRDIKPNNIMVTNDEKIKIMDFGVVKPYGQKTITDSDEFLGTIAYSSPEYLFGSKCNFGTDIYSTGCVFYYMLSGEEPYSEEKIFSRKILAKDHGPPKFQHKKREIPLHHKICRALTEHLISHEISTRINNFDKIIDILTKLENSDWWINRFIKDSSLPEAKNIISKYNSSNKKEKLAIIDRLLNDTMDWYGGRNKGKNWQNIFDYFIETEEDVSIKKVIAEAIQKIDNLISQEIRRKLDEAHKDNFGI